MLKLLLKHKAQILALFAILVIAGLIELKMGRLIFGPSGHPLLFTWDVNTSEQSQTSFDIYSLSHIIHGILFYWLLAWLFPRMALSWRLVAAVFIEAGWEVLENSPLIIDRYRAVTIAWGYVGDSIWNSLSDICMVIIGFFMTHRLPAWATILSIIVMELLALYLVRDNLTLNILMLTFPLESVREWQMGVMPR